MSYPTTDTSARDKPIPDALLALMVEHLRKDGTIEVANPSGLGRAYLESCRVLFMDALMEPVDAEFVDGFMVFRRAWK